jgi:hypothetical protein
MTRTQFLLVLIVLVAVLIAAFGAAGIPDGP